MSSSSLSDSLSSGGYHHQNIGECWPHLIKLSLAAAVVSCQVNDQWEVFDQHLRFCYEQTKSDYKITRKKMSN